ncbi:MAG: hypothetical protein ABJE95_15040 [Byssovorax sp.]
MAEKSSKPVAAGGRKPGRIKWMVLGVLVLAVVIAAQAGFVGYGWAQLKSAAFPRDEALLGYAPADTVGVLIVDPHQIDPKSLGGEGGAARSWLTRTRADILKATGIDLFFDVDKLAVTPAIVVLRGRFDARKIEAHLAEAHYATADYKGQSYLVRAGDDAVAVIDGDVLLYGDEAGVKAAIDAKQGGTSLAKSEQVLERLKSVGWNHPVLLTLRITDEKPSIRSILTGSTGPRAVTVGLATLSGLDVTASIESASPSAADELKKLLEEKRGTPDTLAPVIGPGSAAILVDVAKKATITSQESVLRVQMHVDPAQLDALIKATSNAPALGEAYKNLRLVQLLVPGL